MSFETEELVHFRGRDPVSAYPLIRLRHDFIFTLATTSDIVSHTNGLETLPEPSKFLELLLESLARLVILIRVFDHRLVSIQDLAKFQIIMQVEIYDLTSSERVKRGVKRAWLIGETLALETVEIDLRAPQTSSMAMELEHPLVNIPPQCNTLSMHYPHEQIQDTLEQDLIISHKFSHESQHLTYQDATPEEQVVQSSIVEQAATIVLSTPVAAVVETSLFPSPPLDVEVPNDSFQSGDLYEDIQVSVLFQLEPKLKVQLLWIRNVSTWLSKLQAQRKMSASSLQQVRCWILGIQFNTDDVVKCSSTPLKCDQAATDIMDLDDGEDLATLLERLQHYQLGDIGDWVASDEATLMEGCNPYINDMVLTSVPSYIEGNEINSLCEYEHVMEPPHPFAFSQQPFVQFDEYL
ncbi:unnamed protein product [Sphagnum troendelagicum]|uniref:Uncharacterized protein n=1 Tax=Sphagnum troendelagicum TaxID=128251 RepID=A0ABP0TRG1_9BRYO